MWSYWTYQASNHATQQLGRVESFKVSTYDTDLTTKQTTLMIFFFRQTPIFTTNGGEPRLLRITSQILMSGSVERHAIGVMCFRVALQRDRYLDRHTHIATGSSSVLQAPQTRSRNAPYIWLVNHTQ